MPIWRSEETIPRHEKTLGPDTTVAIQVHAQRLGSGVARCGKRASLSVKSLVKRRNVKNNYGEIMKGKKLIIKKKKGGVRGKAGMKKKTGMKRKPAKRGGRRG
jgi:hypothetical protein|tara:strand:- start:5388 stop:5696 length:309 start_codon:yes stop_codon:yes gene_type:complete